MLSGDRSKLYDEEKKRQSGLIGDAIKAPWLSVRDASGASFLATRVDSSNRALELVAHSDVGGLSSLRSHLADDSVTYAAFAFSPGYPYGEGTRKMAFVTVVGPAVGAIKRGKVALQKSGVYNIFEGIAADVGIFQSAAEATDEAILAELRRNMPKAELLR